MQSQLILHAPKKLIDALNMRARDEETSVNVLVVGCPLAEAVTAQRALYGAL